eukprot:5876257-Prymnesium_polylepis.1
MSASFESKAAIITSGALGGRPTPRPGRSRPPHAPSCTRRHLLCVHGPRHLPRSLRTAPLVHAPPPARRVWCVRSARGARGASRG